MRLQDRLAYILTQLGLIQMEVAPREALANGREALALSEKIQTESMRVEYKARSYWIIAASHKALGRARESCAAWGETAKFYSQVAKLDTSQESTYKQAVQEYARCAGKR
jgi:hypothetical protein